MIDMKQNMKETLIAACGMNCGVCSAYLANKLELKKYGIRRVGCVGCRSRGENCNFMRKTCPAIGEGKYRYCHECPDFPCPRLKRLVIRYQKYNLNMIENLTFIRDRGMEAFLLQEEEKWKCPECGGAICCHNGICFSCQVEKLKSRGKGRYKWEGD